MVPRISDKIAAGCVAALILVVLVQPGAAAFADVVAKRLNLDYGSVSRSTLTAAIEDARRHFASSAEADRDTYVIHIPAGTFELAIPEEEKGAAGSSLRGVIDVSQIEPAPGGRLVIAGAGLDRTTLVMDEEATSIVGRSVFCVTFQDFEMTRQSYTVTQGIVVSVGPGTVVLDIQPGFPTPLSIHEADDETDGGGVAGPISQRIHEQPH